MTYTERSPEQVDILRERSKRFFAFFYLIKFLTFFLRVFGHRLNFSVFFQSVNSHHLFQVPCTPSYLWDLRARHLSRSRLCHAQLLTGEINGIANQKRIKEQHYNHNVNVLLNFRKNENENAKTEAHTLVVGGFISNDFCQLYTPLTDTTILPRYAIQFSYPPLLSIVIHSQHSRACHR